MRYYEFVHNLGIHSWDIPALIVAVILVVMILVHHRNQKKRLNDFEDDLDQEIQEIREEMAENQPEMAAGETVQAGEAVQANGTAKVEKGGKQMRYIIEHTKLGFDWLDLLALIILLVVVIVWAVRRHNLKSEQKDLEDQLSDLYADDSLDAEEADGEEADSSDAD